MSNWADGGTGLAVTDFGIQDYATVWAWQKDGVQRRLQNLNPDMLLLGEHPEVITLGRGFQQENLLAEDAKMPVLAVERGGDITYHGPGQLIVYPIIQLPMGRRDLHRYLRDLESVIIEALCPFGLAGFRQTGWTGVWVPGRAGGEPQKIASVGVAVKQWVTYHGIALNVNTDLTRFTGMHPCGLPSQVMTSMAEQLGQAVEMQAVKAAWIAAFRETFEYGGSS